MCGICGIYNITNNACVNKNLLKTMLNELQHRGPDGNKILIQPDLGLGFCRLSFIDLDGGMQPLYSEDSQIVMVCNGEIFNYAELTQTLKENGHIFKTHTDVEVILHLYEEYGLEFVNYLNGQFAVALYDEKKRRLLLARDHLGIAPLFYTVLDGRIVFSSEIKAILQYPGVQRRLNMEAVDQLLTFPGPIAPSTFFEDIYSLENGHALLIENEIVKNIEFWDVQYSTDSDDLGEKYYTEGLRERMIEAIRQRLIADVPIGFYISGGLDSSIVASYIHHYIPGKYYSFSAEFPSEEYTEKIYQEIVQKSSQTMHNSVVIREEDLWEQMKNVLYYTETPLKETYDVAAYMLSGLVQKSPAKAILTGQGADEFFNGYIGYKFDFIRERKKNNMSSEECDINMRLWGDPYFQYEKEYGKFEQEKKKLYSKNVRENLSQFSAIRKSPVDLNKVKTLKSQRRRSYLDYKLRLTDHLLADHGDRMSFSHSIESRHPFLDRNIIDFAIEMPEKYKLAGSNEKYILKKIAEGIVPDEVLKRHKCPFRAPGMPEMLKKNVKLLDVFMNDELLKKQGVFDVDYVKKLKNIYLQDNFRLNVPYDSDYLIFVLTVTMFNEIFSVGLM